MKRAVLLAVFLVPGVAFGWGRSGHLMIANVGSQLTRAGVPFWKANISNMMMLSDVPDANWKSLPTGDLEKPTHFFQPDSYYADPNQFNLIPESYSACVAKWGKNFVDVSGTAVWRAQQFYGLAVQALKSGDYKTGLEMAGVMAHYIGDMSQPLHDTKNYDGQLTGQPGIHAFFETTNIDANDHNAEIASVGNQATALLSNQVFLNDFKGSMGDSMFREVARAYKFVNPLLAIDKTEGRTGKGAADMLTLAESRMADGAATLAVVLTHLWQDAGNPTGGMTVAVQVPAWVAPNYPLTAPGVNPMAMRGRIAASDDSFDAVADRILPAGRACYANGDGDCE